MFWKEKGPGWMKMRKERTQDTGTLSCFKVSPVQGFERTRLSKADDFPLRGQQITCLDLHLLPGPRCTEQELSQVKMAVRSNFLF